MFKKIFKFIFPTQKSFIPEASLAPVALSISSDTQKVISLFSSENEAGYICQAPIVPLEHDALKKAQYVVDQFTSAVIDQGVILMEGENDFNRGWLRAFEEASDRAEIILKKIENGELNISENTEPDYLLSVLKNELAYQESTRSSESDFDMGAREAFLTWASDDNPAYELDPIENYRVNMVRREVPHMFLDIRRDGKRIVMQTPSNAIDTRNDADGTPSIKVNIVRTPQNTLTVML